jgi:hypothetical protein
MGKFAYICLITSVVSLIIAVVIMGVTMSGRMFVFGTPPGAIAAGIFGLLSFISGIGGIVLSILHARTERFSVPSRVCLALNGVYVGGIVLLVVAGVLVQSRQEAKSKEFLAKYEAERRDEGVINANKEIANFLIANLKQGVVFMPLNKLAALPPLTLSNGFKIVGVYLPKSADEIRDKEHSIIDSGMDKAVAALVVHLVKRKQLPDAIALLGVMEEAGVYGYWKLDERSLGVKELRTELQSATFTAGDQLEASFGSEQIAGFLQGL